MIHGYNAASSANDEGSANADRLSTLWAMASFRVSLFQRRQKDAWSLR
jgi:hypothetical protein